MDEQKDRDEGFSLLETVVAMVIFGIIAASTAAVLVRTVGGASDNRARIAAANVAAAAMDATRDATQNATGYTALATSDLDDQTVQDRVFHVYRSVTPVTGNNAGSACTSGGITNQKYKKVTIQVTWDDRPATIKPVVSDSLIQNPGVSSDPTKGAIGVIVTGPAGNAEAQVPVQLSTGQTVLTDASGCAYFDGLAPAQYGITASSTGFVSLAGQATATSSAGVQQATATTVQLSYARAATVGLSYATVLADGTVDTSYQWPGSWAYTLTSGSSSRSGTATTSSVTPIPGLYPFTAGYTSYLGTAACGNAPVNPFNFASLEGDASTVTIPTGGLTIRNTTSSAVTVTLANASNSTCPAPAPVSVPAGGQAKIAVPFGNWKATRPGLLGLSIASSPSSVTLTQAAPTATLGF
ncbi:type II secretion system protein J [Kineococcus sp. GCM10028916]|uniref:PulJ/GspJ family protein n=1 Tax=Kineococcus sp. GCM10028916 TaxID=3273394 RepID=UPI00363296BD